MNNYTYDKHRITSRKDVTSTPEDAYYTRDAKALKAFDPNW